MVYDETFFSSRFCSVISIGKYLKSILESKSFEVRHLPSLRDILTLSFIVIESTDRTEAKMCPAK